MCLLFVLSLPHNCFRLSFHNSNVSAELDWETVCFQTAETPDWSWIVIKVLVCLCPLETEVAWTFLSEVKASGCTSNALLKLKVSRVRDSRRGKGLPEIGLPTPGVPSIRIIWLLVSYGYICIRWQFLLERLIRDAKQPQRDTLDHKMLNSCKLTQNDCTTA